MCRSRQDSQSSGRPQSAGRGGPPSGQPIGFHRGRGAGAVRGGGYHGGQQHGGPAVNNQSVRGRGGGQRGAGSGFQPGRPQAGKKETLKFDNDYDFEQANETFQGILSKLSKTKIEDTVEAESSEVVNGDEDVQVAPEDAVVEAEDGEILPEDEDEEIYYDKKKSFFDSISCEALERSKGKMVRNDWRAEKKLNKETFGVAGNRRFGYGGRGGYYNNRGGRGFNQGYNNRGFSHGGYGGRGGQRGFGGGYNNGFSGELKH